MPDSAPPLPAVSIVLPLYNKEAFIDLTLQSVLAQTFRDFELVVVDDGSRDGSAARVQSVTDARVRLIRQANAGVSVARNNGIGAARGAWVFFLDGDDGWHPDYLRLQMDTVARHPGCDVVATNYRALDDAHFTIGPWPLDAQAPVEVIEDLPTRWLEGWGFITSCVGVRKTVLDALQPCFMPGESLGEDMDLWFRLGERGPIALRRAAAVAYRVEAAGSLTVQHGVRLEEPPFWQRALERAARPTTPAPVAASLRHFVAESRTTLARKAIAAGQRGRAWRLLWRARHQAGRRWLLTTLMALSWTAGSVARFQHQREQRTTTT